LEGQEPERIELIERAFADDRADAPSGRGQNEGDGIAPVDRGTRHRGGAHRVRRGREAQA
jgi:hypothetical protein